MKTRLNRKDEVSYVGRIPSAATATGLGSTHNRELETLLTQAFE
jgi:2-oxoglutarate dehydrogenase complex dehydrogenase (E1) component-like enzyme